MSSMIVDAAVGVGIKLRSAREAVGMSTSDVAAKLKLSVRQVEAMEAEDWSALPEATFTRGFIRGYARLVGVDESTLQLNAVRPAVSADLVPPPTGIGEVSHDGHGHAPSPMRWLIPLGLLVALIAGVAWFLVNGQTMLPTSAKTDRTIDRTTDRAKSDPVSAEPVLPAVSQVPANNVLNANTSITTKAPAEPERLVPLTMNPPTLTSAARDPGTTPAASVVLPPLVPANANALPVSTATAASPAMPATPAVVQAVSPATVAAPLPLPLPMPTPPPVDGKKRIVLTYTGLSWTEVRSKGDVVFSERVGSGTRELTGAPPLAFVIGNSNNVSMTIDGKPYDFSRSVRDVVARFRIE